MNPFDLADGDIVGAITALEPHEFWIAAGFLTLLCVISFLGSFWYFRRARTMEDIPTSKIRSASQGYVELEGHALPAPSRGNLTSPLSGKTCLWWDYKVEERRAGNRGGNGGWRIVDHGTSKASFVLDDDTGTCLVKPPGASTNVSLSRTWYGPAHKRTPSFTGIIGGMSLGGYRYTERIIVPGEKIYALGKFDTLREEDGIENVLTRPEDGRPFLLATRSQEQVVAALRNTAGNGLAASLASGGTLLWLFGARGLLGG